MKILLDSNSEQYSYALENFGVYCFSNFEFEEAVQYHEKSIQTYIKMCGEGKDWIKNCYENIVYIYKFKKIDKVK